MSLLGHLTAIGAQCDVAALGQRIGQRHAEPPGQVVVAGARRAQRLAAAPGGRPHRLRGGGRHHPLQHLADQRRSQTVIAMPTLLLSRQQAAIGELRQVPARGLRRYAGCLGELLGGQRAPVHQRRQHVGARGIAEQRSGRGDAG